MRLADERAIEGGTPAEVLMDRAGRAVARVAIDQADGRYGKRAVVICGKGNNGGDGFVAARELARAGVRVTCFVTFAVEEATGPAAHHLKLMRAAGLRERPFEATSLLRRPADVIVDAIFGTGFRGRADGPEAAAIEEVNRSSVPVVAADIPSGVEGATGAVEGEGVRADVTVAFAAPKVGTILMPGASYAGRIETVDIGIDPEVVDGADLGPYIALVEQADVRAQPWSKARGSHKLSAGAVGILAGSDLIIGAALLTGRGALRAGSGYVLLGSTRAVVDAAAIATPELVCHQVGPGEGLGPDALDAFKPALERASVVAIGSGLGRGAPQAELVRRVLDELEVPVVVDADALNALDGDLEPVAKRAAPTVLTPHAGELARLLSVPRSEVEKDPLAFAVRVSREAGNAVVICKGEPTLVAGNRGSHVFVVDSGGPELATAGSGDVLTGLVAARLTAVPDAMAAAIGAAYIHGRAGRLVAGRRGSLGLAAWDLAEALPRVTSELDEGSAA